MSLNENPFSLTNNGPSENSDSFSLDDSVPSLPGITVTEEGTYSLLDHKQPLSLAQLERQHPIDRYNPHGPPYQPQVQQQVAQHHQNQVLPARALAPLTPEEQDPETAPNWCHNVVPHEHAEFGAAEYVERIAGFKRCTATTKWRALSKIRYDPNNLRHRELKAHPGWRAHHPLQNNAIWEYIDLYRFNIVRKQHLYLLSTDPAEHALVTMPGFRSSRPRLAHRRYLAGRTARITPYARNQRRRQADMEQKEHDDEQ